MLSFYNDSLCCDPPAVSESEPALKKMYELYIDIISYLNQTNNNYLIQMIKTSVLPQRTSLLIEFMKFDDI